MYHLTPSWERAKKHNKNTGGKQGDQKDDATDGCNVRGVGRKTWGSKIIESARLRIGKLEGEMFGKTSTAAE